MIFEFFRLWDDFLIKGVFELLRELEWKGGKRLYERNFDRK